LWLLLALFLSEQSGQMGLDSCSCLDCKTRRERIEVSIGVDLGTINGEFVEKTYAGGGRPSIDPIVFFKTSLSLGSPCRDRLFDLHSWSRTPFLDR
jgi:hypothetical protein